MGQGRDPSGTARFTISANWVFLVAAIALAASALNTIRVLGGFGGAIAPHDQLIAADSSSFWAGLFYMLAYLVAMIATLRWIYVTNRNAQTWSPHVGITPGWNVGWFFVPVASLFKPFEGVRETYQASMNPDEPGSVPVPAAMRWWWGAWLTGNFHGWLSLIIFKNGATVAAIIAERWFNTISLPILTVQVVALAIVVRTTTRAQVARLTGAALAPVTFPA